MRRPRLTGAGRFAAGGIVLLLLATVAFCAAPKPAPRATPAARRSQSLLALAAAQAPQAPAAATSAGLAQGEAPLQLVRIPEAVILIGDGQVDEGLLLRRMAGTCAPVTICAEQPGVVDYVHQVNDLLCAGDHLVRLYDPKLLEDLAAAEAAAAITGGLPFLIAPSPLVPPPAVPPSRPTAPPKAAGPAAAPAAAPPDIHIDFGPQSSEGSEASGPDLQVGARRQAAPGLAVRSTRQAGGAGAGRGDAGAAQGEVSVATADVAAADTAVQNAEAHEREAEQALKVCQEDLEARQRLFASGVVAQKELGPAQAAVTDAQRALDGARAAAAEARSARRAAVERRGLAQEKLERASSAPSVARPALGAGGTAPRPVRRPSGATGRSRSGGRAARPRPLPEPPPLRLAAPAPAAAGAGFPKPTSGAAALTRPGGLLAGASELPRAGWGRPLPLPPGSDQLAQPRWHDQFAPCDSVVAGVVAPRGATVKKGAPLLKVRETGVVRLAAEVPVEELGDARPGTPIRLLFPRAPGIRFDGWVAKISDGAAPGEPRRALVQFVVSGPGAWGLDAYQTLLWLALSGPLPEGAGLAALSDPVAERQAAEPGVVSTLFDLPPADPPAGGPAVPPNAGTRALAGTVGLALLPDPSPQAGPAARSRAARAQRTINTLRDWRRSFLEGMQTSVFPVSNLVLTYPTQAEIARAVQRLATANVPHEPNRCAGTLAYALGWGLGDAAQWADGLPSRGYVERADHLARPGDILVWQFSFGPRGNQHVGIAVRQGDRLMLLSNLSGRLCTVPLQGGYRAFYKPR